MGKELTWSELRIAFENAATGKLAVDSSRIVREANGIAADILGYQQIELVGQRLDAMVPATYRQRHEAEVAAFFSDPRTRQMGLGRDLLAVRKTGHVIPVEIGLEQVVVEGQRFVIASMLDISGRKRREASEAILASARAKIEICEVLGLAAAIFSLDGRIIEANGSFRAASSSHISARDSLDNILVRLERTLNAIRSELKPRALLLQGDEEQGPAVVHLIPVLDASALRDTEPLAIAIVNGLKNSAPLATSALARIFDLTPAETRVAMCCRMGQRLNEIAARLHVSTDTVKTQLSHIFTKTGVSSQMELALLLGRITIPNDTALG